jgi:ABC-type uncharacterized transport system YnjBCD ATPase subunit
VVNETFDDLMQMGPSGSGKTTLLGEAMLIPSIPCMISSMMYSTGWGYNCYM